MFQNIYIICVNIYIKKPLQIDSKLKVPQIYTK